MQLSPRVVELLILILAIYVDVVGSRGGLGGGGRGGFGGRISAGRGSSAGRSSSNWGSSVSSGRGSGSSYRGGGISTFSKGTGIGSIARSSSFKSAIAGAAAGYLTYQAGRAIIRTAAMAMMWNSRPYYWGPGYYQYRSGYEMCSMPLNNGNDNTFSDVFFENGTRPKMIVWGCHAYSEYCCGYECCPRSGNGILGFIGTVVGMIFIGIFLLLCCGCYISYMSPGGLRRNKGKETEEESVQAPMYTQFNYTQSYPGQPHANQANPLLPQYPQQPPPPGFKPC